MHTVSATRTIDVPTERVWTVLDDFGGIQNFHPLVDHSHTTGAINRGLGAERVCHFHGGGSIAERITDYQPGERYTVDIIDLGPFPLREAQGTLVAQPAGATRTSVTMTMVFAPKYGPAGWLMAKLMMKSQFEKTLRGILKGLDDHLRTGQPVGPDGALIP